MIHMKARFLRSLALLPCIMLCLTACSVSETDPSASEGANENTVRTLSPYLPGVVSVQFDEAMTARVEEALAGGDGLATKALGGSVLDELGVTSLRRVFPYAGEYEPRTRKEGLHRFYYVTFDQSTPVTKAAGDLRDLPGIVSVTPQLPVRTRAFNDPYFSQQWHLLNTRYKDCDIHVQPVWDEFTVGSSNVIVSVVDEGVNMNHEDLVGNLIPCLEDGTGSFNFNNNTPTVVPTQGHGSHVAGVICATNNNGKGVASVAGGDAEKGIAGVKVLSCQIFDQWGAQPDIYQAIKHGADHGAVILQCSWGFSPDMDSDGFTSDEEIALYRSFTIDDLPEYKAAIDYFIKYAGCDNDGNQLPDSPMKGGVAIFAAGNDNFDYDPLVSYEPIIAVGAFGATGNKASYSNWGDWVDVAAPGGDGKQGIYSTLLGNSYGGADWQGTSMACPHVSGVAALLVSHFGGPGFTNDECRKRIVRGARPGFFTGSRYIGRKLDAYGAFTYDMNTPPKPPVLAWSDDSAVEMAYNATVDLPFTVDDPEELAITVQLTPAVEGAEIILDEEQNLSVRIDAGAFTPGEHSVTVKAVNEDNASATLTRSFTVLANRAPVAGSGIPESIRFASPRAETRTLDVSDWFSDPDGDALIITATFAKTGTATAVVKDKTLEIKPQAYGSTTLTVHANDGKLTASVEIPLTVANPEKPAYVFPTQATTRVNVGIDAEASTTVEVHIYGAGGGEVLSWKGEADAFHPAALDVSSLAPGSYLLVVRYNGSEHSLRFVKI